MIRICRYLYINPLTVAFFIICLFTKKAEYFLISYISMLLHECAHLVSALFIGLKISSVSLHPFGVNLRLKNTLVYSICDELILYLSGPLSNLILSLAGMMVSGRYAFGEYAAYVNIMLFGVNMLPVYPLDGGCILKRTMIYFFGESKGMRIITVLSSVISACLLILGISAVYFTGGNYTVIFLSVLCIANIFTVREKYSQDAVRNLMFSNKSAEKDGTKISFFTFREDESRIKLLKLIRPGKYTCFVRLGKDGQICELITEEQMTEKLVGINKNKEHEKDV